MNKQEEVEALRFRRLNQEIKRFAATATGMIYKRLAEMGVSFRLASQDETDIVLYETDTLIFLENQQVSEWLFEFVTFLEDDRELDKLVERTAKGMFESLMFQTPNPKKKVSIVVNNEDLFNYLLGYKGNNSYRGNLSIIYVNVNNIEIVNEEFVSYYDTEYNVNKLI